MKRRGVERVRAVPVVLDKSAYSNDIWIAAATIEGAGHLLTFDTDYEKIPGLEATILA